VNSCCADGIFYRVKGKATNEEFNEYSDKR
jgi:hypothetical protein